MKKNYMLLIASSLSYFGALAQPVLNSTDFNYKYSANVYSGNDIPGLSAGKAGANKTWDFSAISPLTLGGTSSIVPKESTPYQSSFPLSNFVVKSTYNDNSPTYYSYNTITTTKLESEGGADSDAISQEVDHLTIFEFPYTYGKTFTDSSQDVGQSSIETITATYDGYGTLITPYETFTNVIRVKSQDTRYSSSSIDYIWYSANPFKTLMFMTLVSDANYVEIYTDFTTLGLKDFAANSPVRIYPNPVNNLLNVQIENKLVIDKITITNALGKIIIEQKEAANQINVENLASGLYFIEVVSGNEKMQQKFIKK
ncbi:hypothetical protein FFWV33_00415 [Flavobacterium faecale]|uniref:Secretion system C-terminal sorting domain-containing protein n=1 Tax=Flavobacterium faecale TaxID=1355330 RepID=A0A2S1L8S4_9FLAO|nr:T9SS type A sorting domain-containing protein [Flavobacterium faecale]AWG20088.1 hypothetical protein FFWV33_00415 [Flavobacterium faecale]